MDEHTERIWQEAREQFARLGLWDVYFESGYHTLARTKPQDCASCFVYESDDDVFFLPYLRKPMPGPLHEKWDAETVYGYGGPLTTNDCSSFISAAWNAFVQDARSCGGVALFIRFHPMLENVVFTDPATVQTKFQRETVKLTLCHSAEEILKQYSKDTRYNIRKARRRGLEVRTLKDARSLQAFAELYASFIQRKAASDMYRFEQSYFTSFTRLLPGAFAVHLAFRDGKCEGGLLSLHSKRFAHVHLSASNRQARRDGVASLLRHHAIGYYLATHEAMHFGGGLTNDPNDSLFRFKRGFSHERAEFWIGEVVLDEEAYKEACSWWLSRNPSKAKTYGSRFLKYRF